MKIYKYFDNLNMGSSIFHKLIKCDNVTNILIPETTEKFNRVMWRECAKVSEKKSVCVENKKFSDKSMVGRKKFDKIV